MKIKDLKSLNEQDVYEDLCLVCGSILKTFPQISQIHCSTDKSHYQVFYAGLNNQLAYDGYYLKIWVGGCKYEIFTYSNSCLGYSSCYMNGEAMGIVPGIIQFSIETIDIIKNLGILS